MYVCIRAKDAALKHSGSGFRVRGFNWQLHIIV